MKQAVADILNHGMALLDDCTFETYTRVHPGMFGATIGQHYRHVIDHFLCLAGGMIDGQVAYDERKRNSALERDLDHARTVTQMLLRFFETSGESELRRPCKVTSALDYTEQKMVTVGSNFERELAYCISHAVHHFAIVRLMCAALSVSVPAEFGIAPSTLRHRAAQAAN
jgi:uncharacterized damage-inducible protein DinB